MYFYHYVANIKVEDLRTSSQLKREVHGDHGDTLSAWYKPLGKTNIDKLRSAGFVNWYPTLYLYRFDIKDVSCNNIRVSSLSDFDIINECYNITPLEEWRKIKQIMTPLNWDCTKTMITKEYKKYKAVYDDIDKQVAKQIFLSKYHPDVKYRKEIKEAYGYYIPHVMFYLTKPITKIKYMGKF